MKKIVKTLAIATLAVLSFLGLTACGGDSGKEKMYDSITKQCKLTKEYKNKDFYGDGIGEATLVHPTDGDTATFRLTSENTSENAVLTIRFYCINTPESTGGVEKWGKSASLFTQDKLENAETIVLEASTAPAEKDSYGSRYIAFVWYRESAKAPFKNLNLLLVENGYTESKALDTPYDAYFTKAQNFAEANGLHIFGDDEDPNYNDDPTMVTIKELTEALADPVKIEDFYNEESGSGTKVRFTAYLSEMNQGGGGNSITYNWVCCQYDAETGKVYSMPLYSGYSNSAASQGLAIGNLYNITGTIQKHGNDFQISGLTYSPGYSGDDLNYVTVEQRNYYLTFNSSLTYSSVWGTSLYASATVKSVEIKGEKLVVVASAQRVSSKGLKDPVDFTFNLPVGNYTADTINGLVGKSLTTTGYQFTTNEITVTGAFSFN